MSAIRGAPMRCIVCGRSGDIEFHHVAGVAHLPNVIVPVCRTRHVAWHRTLRDAGVVLSAQDHADDCLRERLIATAFGFRVILEDGAMLSDDPPVTRAAIRRRTEAGLAAIDSAALGEGGAPTSAPLRTRRSSSAPPPGEGERDCRARVPLDDRERSHRMEAFLSGLLGALAGLLDASLPPELAALQLPGRLRRINPAQLAVGVEALEGPGCGAQVIRRVAGILSGPEGLLLANLGQTLEVCVEALELLAHEGRADG